MRNLSFWLIPLAVFLAIIFIYESCKRNILTDTDKLRQENELLQLTVAEYATRPPKIDTVWRWKYDTIYISKVFRAVDSVKITDTIYKDVYVKTYNDSIPGRDLTLYYNIKTRGDLLAYSFNYRLKTPEITIEKPLTIYKTPPQRGLLYFGIGASTENSACMSITWVHRKRNWGLSYVNIPVSNSHNFMINFKIR